MQDAVEKGSMPTLAQALHSTFLPGQTDEGFASELSRLALALTTASEVLVVVPSRGDVIASAPADAVLSAQMLEEIALTAPSLEPQQARDAIFVSVALPSSDQAWLVARFKTTGAATRALAFERLVTLGQLTAAHFRHPEFTQLSDLLGQIGAPGRDLEDIATRLRDFVDADFVAIGEFSHQSLTSVALSGQPKATKRATLPMEIEAELTSALADTSVADNISVATNGSASCAIKATGARRNAAFLPVLAQSIAASADSVGALSRRNRSRLVRWGVYVLVACGVCLIPLPDARRVPGEVISLETRTITAPLSGLILDVAVSDGDTVVAGETELARIDTDDTTQELLSAQADYSRVLLDRESARGARDATTLRNAELEAESLRARIDLLEARRARGVILAPITGNVVGNDLSTFVGSTIRQGDTLLEVVDPSQLAIRLDVPDDLLHRIEDGEAGVFRPDFAPRQTFEGTVESISPAQSVRSDISVFEGRAVLTGDTGQLRPGLRGVFVFDREFRMLGRIVFDAVRDWVLLRLWI